MKADCRCCRLVAYIDGVSELAMHHGWPRHRTPSGAIRPISWIRTMRRVRGILDHWGSSDPGRPRYRRKHVWIRLVLHSVECAGTFARHLLELEAGKREAHVRTQIHTAEMIEVARYLEWEEEGARDFQGRVRDEIACEVLERLVGRDDFPARMARVLGQVPPEPKPYLPASWIRGVLEAAESEAAVGETAG